MPSVTKSDGEDYVPTDTHIVFGHHFTSIAGTGPIVGPAIGVIWGWLPALLWIFFGSILMGAVHDFASLVVSLRNEGKTITEITATYISRRVRNFFFIIVFLGLLIVIAIFGLIIALVFARFPESVWPVWAEIPIAVGLGLLVYRWRSKSKWGLWAAKLAFLGTFALGYFFPVSLPSLWGIPATGLWTIILLIYAFIASALPVTALLQPRDYLNAWQLYVVMAVVLLGVLVTGITGNFPIAAPAINTTPAGAPSLWPFLFITIACGAVSGFHSLVSSGTSAKQLRSEKDATVVGYGAMLVEALLATLVIIAVTAGISLAYTDKSGQVLTGLAAWKAHYGSWAVSDGLGSKLDAVVIGTSNILTSIGISSRFGIVIIGVFIASFAGTTLDSSARIQRYIIAELSAGTRVSWLANKWAASFFAVATAAALAFSSGADGKGALALWPLFGSVNQLLAALALMVATAYLRRKGGLKYLVTGIPCIIMTVISVWAIFLNQLEFWRSGTHLLSVINGVVLLLSLAITVEAAQVIIKGKLPEKDLALDPLPLAAEGSYTG